MVPVPSYFYNYGNQAISGKAILPTEPTLYFRIKKLEDAYYPGTPIVDYTLPAATVEGETVTPGNQTFIVWFTPNCISPRYTLGTSSSPDGAALPVL